MSDKKVTIQELKDTLSKFVKERDWEQFHSPKNLTMSIAIEAAELMEKFQWLDVEQSKNEIIKNKKEIEEEIADITAYILSLCNLYNIDLSDAIIHKMELNAKKYPVEKSKGKADKYTKI